MSMSPTSTANEMQATVTLMVLEFFSNQSCVVIASTCLDCLYYTKSANENVGFVEVEVVDMVFVEGRIVKVLLIK